MNRILRIFTLLAGGVMLLLTALPTNAQDVTGSMSNFDVRNTDRRAHDGFELILFGDVTRECIRDFYPGWGGSPRVRPTTSFGPGLTILWRSTADPIGPERTEHFGIEMVCKGPIAARGFWLDGDARAREIPVPWQVWSTRGGAILDIIQAAPDSPSPSSIQVRRQWVTLPEPLSLRHLNWDDVERLVARLGRRWVSVEAAPLASGEPLELRIPVTKRDAAVLVRYQVNSRRTLLTRFVNQATLAETELCPHGLPSPEVEILGAEDYETSGGAYTRYRVSVTNWDSYPDSLFAAAPDLPPCGSNPNASRTWVDLIDGDGKRLYGFCALESPDDLDSLWFGLPRGTPPPACVKVRLTDRRCEQSYTSSCAPIEGLGPACIDFESPTLGTTYSVGDVLSDSGATMRMMPFQWSSGALTSDGHASIGNADLAHGAGQELAINNVSVDVAFPVKPNVVHLKFGEYGGNLNLQINGDLKNVENFADLNSAVVGGATLSVTNGLGHDYGELLISGEVNSLAIGGQELAVDNICFTEQPSPDAEGTWIMPYGVGGTPLYGIDANGLTDYVHQDHNPPLVMNDAPFGSRLGIRLGKANAIPTPQIYYYRLRYRHESESDWTDFSEIVRAHYQVESPGATPVFPTIKLGPNEIDGKNLYRFQPHEEELDEPLIPALGPGQTASWPSTGWIGDIYSGFLTSTELPPGKYLIRLEIYDQSGAQVTPESSTFEFVVPISHDSDGTLHTDAAPPASVSDGGFEFSLHIDNRPTGAAVDAPMLDGASAGDCGFLRYDPIDPKKVDVSFHATQPDNFAIFSYRIMRGAKPVTGSGVYGIETSASSASPYSGDGSGNFTGAFTIPQLLETCTKEAAFAQVLNVFAKATTGWRTRIESLDRSSVFAFAVTPKEPETP